MITVYIESADTITYNRIRYTMAQMLVPIGFPFAIAKGLNKLDNGFAIACVPEWLLSNYSLQDFDLIIPYGHYTLWASGDSIIESDKVEGIPVFYIGKKPDFLIRDRKVGFDLINIAFFLLSRQEEYTYTHRDHQDCFAATYSILYEQGILGVPVLNCYIKYLESYIRQQIQDVPEQKWKNGANYAVILTHDVDHLPSKHITITFNRLLHGHHDSGFTANLLSCSKEFLSYLSLSKPTWELLHWLRKEDEYGFRSVFFMSANTKHRHFKDPSYWIHSKLMYKGKKIPLSHAVKDMEENGWEIGLHASINSYRDQQLLSKEKDLLVNKTGCAVAGVRHHHLRFDIQKTWRIHESVGFSYDTTLGYNERNGFRAGIAFPFTPYDLLNDREYNLLELPMSIMDGNFFTDHGEKLDALKAVQRCKKLFDAVEQNQGLLVVNFHPHYYATTHPDWWTVYEYVLKRSSEPSVWVATGNEITEWWKEKRKRLICIK